MASPQTYLDLLASAGIPATDPRVSQLQAVIRRTPRTPQITQAFNQLFPGVLPKDFHIAAGGGVQKNPTKTQLALTTAGVFALPIAAATLGAGAAASGGAGGGGSTAAGAKGLSKYLPQLIDVGSQVAGGIEAGREAGRDAENAQNATDYDYQLAQQRAELQRLDADLAQRNFQNQNYQRQADNAVRGGLLQGLQDVSIEVPEGITMGKITGGARPSAISGKEEIGNILKRNAMIDLLDPSKVNGQSLSVIPTVPKYTPGQRPTGLDTGLGAANLIGAGASLIQDIIAKNRRRTTPLPRITAPVPSGVMRGVSF